MPNTRSRDFSRRALLQSLALGSVVLPAVSLPWVAPALAQQDAGFADWVRGVRQQAVAQGISGATVDRAFYGVEPIPRIVELDHRQPETTLSFSEYVARIVSPERQETGRRRLQENWPLLRAVGQRYGVQPRFIVALWGIETDFGRLTGTYSEIAALATLAYNGRRANFFRHELLNALLIIDRYHVDPRRMMGSWAGAMGQSQFMPSSYLHFAVSYSGRGAPDIWGRQDDVFASIANYLARSGWHGNEGWGRRVRLPPRFDPMLATMDDRRPVESWAAMGVRREDGGPLPVGSPVTAALILPDGGTSPALLVYPNFRTLLRWNNSKSFAAAVGLLADSFDRA